MKEPFCHDIRSVLTAPGKALSLKSIGAATLFLITGYVVYSFLTYLALVTDGGGVDYIWGNYGFFPFKLFAFHAITAKIIFGLGLVGGVFCFALAIMAVAVISFEEIRGDYFFSIFDAIRFTIGRIPTLLGSFISMLAFVGFIYLLIFLIGLLGRVPVVGDILVSLFYIVPIFLTLFLTLFVMVIALCGVILLPIIIAAQKEKEIFGALLQLFSIVIKQPLRFAWYLIVTTILAKLSAFVLTYFVYQTVLFSRVILVHGGGVQIEKLFNNAFNMLPLHSKLVSFMTHPIPGLEFGFKIHSVFRGDSTIGGIILAVSLSLIFVALLGYMTAVLSTGMARGYAVIRRMKDDYFIADEKPLVSHEDYANPPYDAPNDVPDDKSSDNLNF